MDRLKAIKKIRNKLSNGKVSIGSWMQLSDSSVGEIMGKSGYDWVAIDQEHGSISLNQLPDIFRSLELGNTLPLVRISDSQAKECKQVLDAGAGGLILSNIQTAQQLESIKLTCSWPPIGKRSVGFSRANLFGERFDEYKKEAQSPILVAMIEDKVGLKNLKSIIKVKGLDAILIGPYDLSASLGIIGDFENKKFKRATNQVTKICKKYRLPIGFHLVEPSEEELSKKISEIITFKKLIFFKN